MNTQPISEYRRNIRFGYIVGIPVKVIAAVVNSSMNSVKVIATDKMRLTHANAAYPRKTKVVMWMGMLELRDRYESLPAFGEGFDSFNRGESKSNPYAIGTDNYNAWEWGWDSAYVDAQPDNSGD